MSSRKTKSQDDAPKSTPAGGRFVAVVGLSDKAGKRLAEPGETCERVPDSSIPYLLVNDPQQVIPVDIWADLTLDRRDWLIAAAASNWPWRTALNTPAWLADCGLIPAPAAAPQE